MKIVVVALALICCANVNYQNLLARMRELDEEQSGSSISLSNFLRLNKKLMVPSNNEVECSCGCFNSPLPDCPTLYDVETVQESARTKVSKEIQEFMEASQTRQKRVGEEMCRKASMVYKQNQVEIPTFVTSSGGFCLHALLKLSQESDFDRGSVTYPSSQRSVPLPSRISQPCPEFLEALYRFIIKEGIQSINDLGAGVGSYGTKLEERFHDQLVYRGFDGASDVEDYTRGYIKFFDMSIPMNIPKSDWVMFLDVGQYAPLTLEGMIIRNLTANNCKGIILSWKTPDQPGSGHINLHNNQYLINIFEQLGYRFDNVETRMFKEQIPQDSPFQKSFLILRRLNNICAS